MNSLRNFEACYANMGKERDITTYAIPPNNKYFANNVAMTKKETGILILSVRGRFMNNVLSRSPLNASTNDPANIENTKLIKMLINH